MPQTVGDLAVERLRQGRVHRIFGYPGDGINGVLGAARQTLSGTLPSNV